MQSWTQHTPDAVSPVLSSRVRYPPWPTGCTAHAAEDSSLSATWTHSCLMLNLGATKTLSPFRQTCFPAIFAHGAAPPQVQDFVVPLIELHEIPLSLVCWDLFGCSTTLWWYIKAWYIIFKGPVSLVGHMSHKLALCNYSRVKNCMNFLRLGWWSTVCVSTKL